METIIPFPVAAQIFGLPFSSRWAVRASTSVLICPFFVQEAPASAEWYVVPSGATPTASRASAKAANWMTGPGLTGFQVAPLVVERWIPWGVVASTVSVSGCPASAAGVNPAVAVSQCFAVRAGAQLSVECDDPGFRGRDGVEVGVSLPGDVLPVFTAVC